MSRAPSPHMVLALQAGLVSQELLAALTAVDTICAALACSLSSGTHIQIVMHGSNNAFRLSSRVVQAYNAFLVHNYRREWE